MMPIRHRITKPKEMPENIRVSSALFVVGTFYVKRYAGTRRFYVFDGAVAKPKRSISPIGEGYAKLPEAVAAAKGAAERRYL